MTRSIGARDRKKRQAPSGPRGSYSPRGVYKKYDTSNRGKRGPYKKTKMKIQKQEQEDDLTLPLPPYPPLPPPEDVQVLLDYLFDHYENLDEFESEFESELDFKV